MVNLSACFAVWGRCSQICMPGTFVEIGLNSPRISFGAFGFIAKVSMWPQPPLCQTRMHETALRLLARSTLSKVIPRAPSEPMRRMSRRPNKFMAVLPLSVIVQELLRIQQCPEHIFQTLLLVLRLRHLR